MHPPIFEKENLSTWCTKMIFFLKTLGRDVFASISKEFKLDDWSANAFKSFEADAKARFAILHALQDDISCIAHCSSAFSMWSLLVENFETNICVASSPCMSNIVVDSTSKKKNKKKNKKKKEKKEKEIHSELDPPISFVAQDVGSCEVISQPTHVVEHVCFSSFDEEICVLKNRIDGLSTTLSECASTTLKFESLCCKENDFCFEKSQPTRKSHKRVLHCKCCGRDGHIAMFFYDRVANFHVRGQNPNLFVHKNSLAKAQPFAPLVWKRRVSQK